MASLRLVFMGTPRIAVPILAALIEAGFEVVCVYTQPPRRAGRGQRETRSAVHRFAAAAGIEVRTPATLRDAAVQAAFAALNADAAAVAAYGLILPAAILDAPRLGCLNVHASLLPRWRGAAPIQHAILAGDDTTGVTIMCMDEGLDTGAMLLSGTVPITVTTTADDLHDRLAALGARLITEALDGLAAGRLEAAPQPATGVTLAPKLTRADGVLDWRRPAAELDRRVRALNPWPGTWFTCGTERIRVLAAAVAGDGAGDGAAPGTVLDAAPTVACGAGGLRLVRLQRPGRAAMEADAFLRGFPLSAGTRLALPADAPE
jgi:methionyl-tRNA formyltransferase